MLTQQQTEPKTVNKAKAPKKTVIESRFGKLKINEDKTVCFPYGIPGIPGTSHYALADLPIRKELEKFNDFKVLQSLDDESIAFLVLPINKQNVFIEESDLNEARQSLAIDDSNLVTLLITSIQRTPESIDLSVNTRAPVLIDVENQLGAQYIFMNNKYNVRHILGDEIK